MPQKIVEREDKFTQRGEDVEFVRHELSEKELEEARQRVKSGEDVRDIAAELAEK